VRVADFHLVFTLPGSIADIAYHNKAVIYGLLFTAAAEATLTIAADPQRLGAKIGITAVLHSWGRASLPRCGRREILIPAHSGNSIQTGIFSRLPAGSMTQTAPSPRFGLRRIWRVAP
jgi:hypothetical protein